MSNQSGSPITLSSYNTVNPANNVLNLPLSTPYNSRNEEVCLSTLLLYYSWRNITAAYGNNTFSYIFNGVTTAVTLTDGNYSAGDMSNALQQEMQALGQYLLDSNGNPVYYLSLQTNPTYYAISIISTPVPTILPSGWSNPNSISLTGNTPQFIVNNSLFGNLIGFSIGTYPATPQTVVTQSLSNKVPVINPVTSVNLSCNLVNNTAFNSYSQSIYTFNYGNISYGQQITIQPPYPFFYRVSDSQYQNITLTFTDENNAPLQIIDPNITVTLVIRKR